MNGEIWLRETKTPACPGLQARGPAGERTPSVTNTYKLFADAWQAPGFFPCQTSAARSLRGGEAVYPESFTATLVADLLLARDDLRPVIEAILAMLSHELGEDGLLFFFKQHDRLPADADCTALALSVLLRAGVAVKKLAHRALDTIADNHNIDGIVETYFDPSGERSGLVDPVVCCNVLYLAEQLDRLHEFRPTYAFVSKVLRVRGYLSGTRYYHGPDTFLYFAARFVCRQADQHRALRSELRQAVLERIGSTHHPLDLAQRVIVARWLGIDASVDRRRLQALRQSDGGWPGDGLFRYGRREVYFGSRVLTTAFALRALEGATGSDKARTGKHGRAST